MVKNYPEKRLYSLKRVIFSAVLKIHVTITNECFWICVFSSTGYQSYKKLCGLSSADADREAPSLEAGDNEAAKEKDYAVENSAFEFDENGNSEEKDKCNNKNTQLWGCRPAKLWTIGMNIQGRSTTEDSSLSQLWTHTALCRPEMCTAGPVPISFGECCARAVLPWYGQKLTSGRGND